MTVHGLRKLTFGAAALGVIMMISLLMPTQTQADALSGNPCPHYSIQNVFDDPNTDWDGDRVTNSDELYNGLNPCIWDTDTFCGNGGNALCYYPNYEYVTVSACQQAVDWYPHGDYDRDGISNSVELRNYADPCNHPCPYPTNADLALNPHGSWDADGASNLVEINAGTNPCDASSYPFNNVNPCPYYTRHQVAAHAGYDWDGDGYTNGAELRSGTNPCIKNQRLQHVVIAPQKLPHVTYVTQVAPKPPAPVCPHGYPYYHPGNGLCYANPVGRTYHY